MMTLDNTIERRMQLIREENEQLIGDKEQLTERNEQLIEMNEQMALEIDRMKKLLAEHGIGTV